MPEEDAGLLSARAEVTRIDKAGRMMIVAALRASGGDPAYAREIPFNDGCSPRERR
uniref:hypothetical protein n=1 Tax=Actinacidiphila bryophytorum TaxID=1436133 RepID=UPI003969F13C